MPRLHRSTDPITSQQGAKKVSAVRASYLQSVVRYVRLYAPTLIDGKTAEEIAAGAKKMVGIERLNKDSYRKRVGEAATKGKIKKASVEHNRRCTVTGEKAAVFYYS